MANIPITIAAGDYDRTRAIRDGRVTVEGCNVTYLPMHPEELFFRAIRYQEFDVCELSFSTYLMQRQRGISGYIAIPVFLSRVFRHSGFYIRTDRGIDSPEALKGKRVGVPEYQMTAAVWQRGLLQDEYDVAPSEITWRTGGLEQPGREERMAFEAPEGGEIKPLGPGETLNFMLESGELDAVIAPRTPACFLNGSPDISRLFPDYRAAEHDYYRKTGLHPIMHLVGVRQSLVEANPWLPASLYKAFRQAKDIALAELDAIGALAISLPWVGAEVAATKAVLGDDIWPYGVEDNRRDIDALIRYSHAQGLTARPLAVEEVFAETTLAVPRI
jgi:4,5-dihydroxyphthalate decarboxylase